MEKNQINIPQEKDLTLKKNKLEIPIHNIFANLHIM
jgi:hypothetical protein